MSSNVKVAGTWEDSTEPYVKVSGVWKVAKSAWVKLDEKWQSWFLQGGISDRPLGGEDDPLYENFTVKTGTQANNYITALEVQTDGKIIIGGFFTSWNGSTANRVVRLNSDGTTDTAFLSNIGTGANGSVSSIKIQPDGKILIGGYFTSWSSTSINYIVRLNSDGTEDIYFTSGMGVGPNAPVRSIALSSDGKILVVGEFTAWTGTGVGRIAQISAAGVFDADFNNFVGSAANNTILDVAIQPNNSKIIVAGNFSTWGGIGVGRVVALNYSGARDATFSNNVGNGSNAEIKKIIVQPDSKILLLSEEMTTWNGSSVNKIIRLESSGTADTAFNTAANSAIGGTFNGVSAMALQVDGKIIFGGDQLALGRLNANGTRDTAFDASKGYGFGGTGTPGIYFLSAQADGKIFVSGLFLSWDGTALSRFVRLNSDGSSELVPGANNVIYSVANMPGNKILIGGLFRTWDGVVVNGLACINSDGTLDTNFSSNVGLGVNVLDGNYVTCISVQDDDKIIVGGYFTSWNGITVNRVVRLNSNGTRDISFSDRVGTGPSNIVESVAIQSDGKIVLGGWFTSWAGTTVNRIVRLNSDGTRDTAFTTSTGTAANDRVNVVTIQADGKILVGGFFDRWNGVPKYGLIRLQTSGALDTTFAGANDATSIRAIAIQSDGKVVVGGGFGRWNGVSIQGIVRLNADGTRDTGFSNSGTSGNLYGYFSTSGDLLTATTAEVLAIHIQEDQKIVIGGVFGIFDGVTALRIARINSNGTRDSAFIANSGTGANNTVRSIIGHINKKIIVGGSFIKWNSAFRYRFVRLGGEFAS
jgi:uncharacterized delta-60 repeat protein